MPRFVRSVALAWPVALLAAAVGCFGGTHNPGYFPNLLPPGDIIQTHAKPGGGAYYRDFDPRAVRLEVTPTNGTNKPGGQQVLVATVYDADGTPRRGRRVEWMIDGPGHIVEVDESGIMPGRGYKVSDKYAVGYTNLFDHVLSRGTKDTADDVTLAPGQTWCVVSSAVPGETVVTAYAPGVFNWEKGRVTVKVGWGDASNYEFPPPTKARFGGTAALSTHIRKVAEKEGVNPSDLRVRYRVVGGLPVDFEPPRGTSGTLVQPDSLEFPADSDGRAGVKVKQASDSIQPGRTDIAIEILKPGDGTAATKVVGRSNTSVEWLSPAVQIDLQVPKAAAVGKEAMVTVVVTNTGKVEGSPGTVVAGFTEGLDVGAPTPAPDKRSELLTKTWSLPALPPGGKQEYRIPVRAGAKGTYQIGAGVKTDDGLQDQKRITFEAGTAALKVAMDPKRTAIVGERVPVKFTVTNTGSVPLDTATATFQYDNDGLEHDSGEAQATATVGILEPGESKVLTVPLTARKSGLYKVRTVVRAGELSEEAAGEVDVRRMELAATISGPEKLAPGADGLYEIGVSNRGDATIPNVTVRAAVPGALVVKQISDSGTINGQTSAVWRIGDLAPGASKVLKLSATGERLLDKGAITVTAASGDLNPKDPKANPALTTMKADAPVSVQGQPALVMELDDPQQAVPVGRRAAYRVVLKNNGNAAAKNVRVTVTLPDEYANARGSAADREAVKPEGNKVIFPAIPSIPPGGSAVMMVEVEGAKAGDARVRAEAKADHLTKPLSEEQSTKVIERAR